MIVCGSPVADTLTERLETMIFPVFFSLSLLIIFRQIDRLRSVAIYF